MNDGDTVRFIREEIRRNLNIILSAVAGATDETTTEVIDNLFPGMTSLEPRPVMHPYGFVSRAKQKTVSVVAKTGEHPGSRMVIGHRDAMRPDIEAEGEVMLYNSDGQQFYMKNGELVQTLKKLTINADGDVEVTTTGKYTLSVDGDMLPTIKGKLTEEVDGDVEKTFKGKTIVKSTDDATFETLQGDMNLLVDLVGKALNLGATGGEPFVLGTTLTNQQTDLITQLQTINGALITFGGALASATDPVVQAAAAALVSALSPVVAALISNLTVYLTTPTTNIVSQKIFGVRGP